MHLPPLSQTISLCCLPDEEEEEEEKPEEDKPEGASTVDSDAGLILADEEGIHEESDDGQEMVGLGAGSGGVPELVEDAAEGGGTEGKGRKGGKRYRRPTDHLLTAMREFCRRVYACIARQGRDRVSGRFFGQDIRDSVARLTKDEQDHLSDDDYVAVREKVGGKQVLRIALVERLLRCTGSAKGAGAPEDASRLAVDDPAGRLVLRVLQPIGKGMTCHGCTLSCTLSKSL